METTSKTENNFDCRLDIVEGVGKLQVSVEYRPINADVAAEVGIVPVSFEKIGSSSGGASDV